MAKKCIGCNCQIGFSSGEHFGGMLCDNCYNVFGGKMLSELREGVPPEEFKKTYSEIKGRVEKSINSIENKNEIKKAFYRQVEMRWKRVYSDMEFDTWEDMEFDTWEEEREKENNRVDYANSFNEFYEYDVVTIINADHGTVDKVKMINLLTERAKKGWRLHSIYSNELGKNALSLLGFGINSTASEDVLIFERRVQSLEK